MSWTVDSAALASLQIDALTMVHQSMTTGSATFRLDGILIDQPCPFVTEETISIADPNGVIRFSGPVTKTHKVFSGQAEAHEIEAADPWHWLEHTAYKQTWTFRNGTTTGYKSRVILGINTTVPTIGLPVTMEVAIRQILTFAGVTCGLPITAGNLDLPGYFKATELNGVTCAEAIRQILKWQPDVVGYWSFGGGFFPGATAALNIVRRVNLPVINAALDGKTVTTGGFTPRNDLVPAAVNICYELATTVDGIACHDQVQDIFPAGGSGIGYKVLDFTVPLQGNNYRFIKEVVQTRPMFFNPVGDPVDCQRWVGQKLGLTGGVLPITGVSPQTPSILFKRNASGNFFDISLLDATEADGSEDPLANADPTTKTQLYFQQNPNAGYTDAAAKMARAIVLDTDLPNELVHGRIRPWMGVQAQKWVVWCCISYQPNNGPAVTNHLACFTVMATDAVTKVYSELSGVTIGETTPVGVAQQIYDGLSPLHYEGTLETEEVECSGALQLGTRLNVINGAPEWAGMAAQVQQVTEDVINGKTSIRTGVPAHLGVNDFLQLQAALRRMPGLVGLDYTRLWEQLSSYV